MILSACRYPIERITTKKLPEGEISNQVYEFRVLARLSQQELADAVGVSKQTIYAMEKGSYSPTLALAFKIAQYFDQDINKLFSYTKTEKEKNNETEIF